MAGKSIDLAKYEGKWVDIKVAVKNNPQDWDLYTFFIKNGRCMQLNIFCIGFYNKPLFNEYKIGKNQVISKITPFVRVPRGLRALAKAEFGSFHCY